MAQFKKWLDPYILLMLAMVVLAAIAPVSGESEKTARTIADAAIVFLFFLYGTRLSPGDALAGLAQWKLQIAVLLSTFALFPLLGLGLVQIAPASMPSALITGLVFLCVLPSTVQSSIALTSMAGGNVAAALCAASASNILGVFVSPVLAGLLLHTQHAVLSVGIFQDIVVQLLVPFILGQLARPLIGASLQRHKALLGYVDRGSILLIIYVAFSKGTQDNIWAQVDPPMLLLTTGLLALLLTAALASTLLLARKLLRLSPENEIVLQFCGSKKSLASGLPIATILFPGPELSLIILPLMLFHQMQLVVCTILARRYAARASP